MALEITSPDVLESMPGGSELLAWFGCVPSFHDAEILDLHLSRKGPSTLRIYTWEKVQGSETEDWPPFTKHVVVTFMLEEIEALELEDFSPQNVIYGLELKRIKEDVPSFGMTWIHSPRSKPDLYEIVLLPCYGLCGMIRARRISIALSPGKPDVDASPQK